MQVAGRGRARQGWVRQEYDWRVERYGMQGTGAWVARHPAGECHHRAPAPSPPAASAHQGRLRGQAQCKTMMVGAYAPEGQAGVSQLAQLGCSDVGQRRAAVPEPHARSVAPATHGGSRSASEISSRAGQKKRSATTNMVAKSASCGGSQHGSSERCDRYPKHVDEGARAWVRFAERLPQKLTIQHVNITSDSHGLQARQELGVNGRRETWFFYRSSADTRKLSQLVLCVRGAVVEP
jgi:hypothetical protein